MGKRNVVDQNGGPNSKRAKLNGHHQHNGDISSCEVSPPSCKESPKPEYQLTRDLVNGTILTDLTQKKWRIGKPIGKGSFGEIFLASDNIYTPVTSENAKYVVKIEPHSNGPLFVEIHCLLNTAKNSETDPLPPGMPCYIASGSHYFKNTRYRFLILQRFDRDLHSIIKNRRVDQKSVLILAIQILDVLQHLHDKGYCHSDIKAENLMVSKCTFRRSIQNGETSSSEEDTTSACEDDEEEEEKEEEEEHSNEEEDSDVGYKTPVRQKKIQYSGSNPVRSCRVKKRNSIYQEMVKSHYLRPAKKINYSEFFGDENSKSSEDDNIDAYLTRHKIASITRSETRREIKNDLVTEDRIFLIDFGLASKFIDSSGAHRPFCMDQRRAHDGTLEFTSRDAHMGAHSRRSDLECLGYNLIFWSQGYLPWKDIAAQNQPEKVHWMKEYLMADVKEMLKHIYGKSVPKYLGEYMQYVGKLAYDERPDYKKCKRIFQHEFIKLGYKVDKMILSVSELIKNSVDIKEEIENNNIFEMKNIKSIMKNLGMLMPFRESNSNRVSPKNLRSKSEKDTKKKRKRFSWAEILSQDPDQIARNRAEKEFEREQTTETPLIRYSGRPTYAILAIENRMKFKDRLDHHQDDDEEDVHIKGYTKPMMEVLKKRQASLLAQFEEEKKQQVAASVVVTSNKKTPANTRVSRLRAKAGLRTVITPTKRGLDYNHEMVQRRAKRSHKNSGDFTTDESSCSSINSVASSNSTGKNSHGTTSNVSSLRNGAQNSSCPSGLSDDDTRDDIVVFSPKRTRHATNKIIEATVNTMNISATTGSRRKKKTPRKRNARVKAKKAKKAPFRIEEDEEDDTEDHSSDSDFVIGDWEEDEDEDENNDKESDDDDSIVYSNPAKRSSFKRTRAG